MPTIAGDLMPRLLRHIHWNCGQDEVLAIALMLKLIKAEDVEKYIKRYDMEDEEDDGF